MTEYKLYPNLSLMPPENPQVAYHVSVIQAKMQGLKNKEKTLKQKYEKYTKILNRLTLEKTNHFQELKKSGFSLEKFWYTCGISIFQRKYHTPKNFQCLEL